MNEEIAEDLEEILRKKRDELSKIYHLKGYFAKDIKQEKKEMLEKKGTKGFGLWTTAEGLLAFLETCKDEEIDETFLYCCINHIFQHILHDEEDTLSAPAYPDFPKYVERGVVDSTTRVILALSLSKKYLLERGMLKIKGITVRQIDDYIKKLLVWLIRNQNNDGGWGLWKGVDSRTDPTSFAVQVLVENRECFYSDSLAQAINDAKKWFADTANSDGGWGDFSDSPSDAANTAYALIALTEIEKTIASPLILAGVEYLRKNTDWNDVRSIIPVPNTKEKGEDYKPTKYRALSALLKAGENPNSEIIRNLLNLIKKDDKDKDYKEYSYYKYVTINSIQIYLDFEQKTGLLQKYIKNGKTFEGMYNNLDCKNCIPPKERGKIDNLDKLDDEKKLWKLFYSIFAIVFIGTLFSFTFISYIYLSEFLWQLFLGAFFASILLLSPIIKDIIKKYRKKETNTIPTE